MNDTIDYARLATGDWAPWFEARTPAGGSYNFGSIGGVWIVVAFLGSTAAPASQPALAALDAARGAFDGEQAMLFCVTSDPRDEARVADQPPGRRWLMDQDFAISRLYGAAPLAPEPGQSVRYQPRFVVLDPQLRVHAIAAIGEVEALLGLVAALPDPADHAGIEMHAPVLIIPRVLEPEMCDRLIALYDGSDVIETGVMRERGGMTVHELDGGFKRRSDCVVKEQELVDGICARIQRRVVPAIERAFQFTATYVERHIVSCYDSENGGRFRPHRDNTTDGTAHRRFAVSINLNDGFTGGELVFPEFGMRGYKAPPGAAVVFGCGLLHCVRAMTSGRRFAYLPFLYDEAAAALRERNLANVDARLPAVAEDLPVR